MLRFSGLVMFPFDDLKCGVDMGGWMISGAQQGIELWGEGFAEVCAIEPAVLELVVARIARLTHGSCVET